VFSGERAPPMPYNGTSLDIVNLAEKMKLTATDVRNVALSLVKAPPPDEEDEQHLIIFDLPVHRNESISSKAAGTNVPSSFGLYEHLDAIPLGTADQMASHLLCYKLIIYRMLRQGGRVIMKLFDLWDGRVVALLYKIVRKFSKICLFANPYSKSLSKEIYVVLSGYKLGSVPYDVFLDTVAIFSNEFMSRLTARMVKVMLTHRSRCVVREVHCRKSFVHLKCLPLALPLYIHQPDVKIQPCKTIRGASFGDDRNLTVYYSHLKLTEEEIRILLHYQRNFKGQISEIPHGDALSYLLQMNRVERNLMDSEDVRMIKRRRKCTYIEAMEEHHRDVRMNME
jgi:hypothetical protein